MHHAVIRSRNHIFLTLDRIVANFILGLITDSSNRTVQNIAQITLITFPNTVNLTVRCVFLIYLVLIYHHRYAPSNSANHAIHPNFYH